MFSRKSRKWLLDGVMVLKQLTKASRCPTKARAAMATGTTTTTAVVGNSRGVLGLKVVNSQAWEQAALVGQAEGLAAR